MWRIIPLLLLLMGCQTVREANDKLIATMTTSEEISPERRARFAQHPALIISEYHAAIAAGASACGVDDPDMPVLVKEAIFVSQLGGAEHAWSEYQPWFDIYRNEYRSTFLDCRDALWEYAKAKRNLEIFILDRKAAL